MARKLPPEVGPAISPADPVGDFARELRDLRTAGGNPSFRQMARHVHYSSSALAEACQGRKLPTEAVVVAFARACNGDPREWVDRLGQAIVQRDHSAESSIPQAGWSRRRTVLSLAGAGLIAAIAGAVLAGLVPAAWAGHPSDGQPAAGQAVSWTFPADGADPSQAGCGYDTILAARSVLVSGGHQLGVLELRYSPRCKGGWARFYLLPGVTPALVEVRIEAQDGRAASFAYQATQALPVYTDLLHPTGQCLRAVVSMHLNDQIPTTVTGCPSLPG